MRGCIPSRMVHTLAVLESQAGECEAEVRQLKEECEALGSKPSTDPEILK